MSRKFLSELMLANNAVIGGVFETILSTDVLNVGTVTSVATGTGLTGGPITTTGTVALANTAVTPAAYTNANITVDQQGRITAAANGTGATPGGSNTQVQFNDSSAFGGSAEFVWDKTNKTLTIASGTISAAFNTGGVGAVIGKSGKQLTIATTGAAAIAVDGSNHQVTLCNGSVAMAITDGGTSANLCDGTYVLDATAGNIRVVGSAGNTLRIENTTTAPATQTLLTLPLNVYGQGTITDLLGDPDSWVLVNIAGTNYKLPAYLA